TNLLRPYAGLGQIQARLTQYSQTYQSVQTSFNRRFRNGLSFGINHTLSLAFTGNTGLPLRLEHAADGSYSVRADQADYEALMNDIGIQRHIVKANAVWD